MLLIWFVVLGVGEEETDAEDHLMLSPTLYLQAYQIIAFQEGQPTNRGKVGPDATGGTMGEYTGRTRTEVRAYCRRLVPDQDHSRVALRWMTRRSCYGNDSQLLFLGYTYGRLSNFLRCADYLQGVAVS